MVVVPPTPNAVTIPVVDPTVPLAVLLLVHVPPAGVAFNVAVLPEQSGVLVIGEGLGLTVTMFAATFIQPVGSV